MSGFTETSTSDGRTLEVLTGGAEGGYPLLFHSGTPSAAAPYDRLDDAFVKAGLRMVTYSRPGYGGSTPRDLDGASSRIADDVPDSVAVLDHLGIDEFITLGWSGGGPGRSSVEVPRSRAAVPGPRVCDHPQPGLGERVIQAVVRRSSGRGS